MKPSSRRHATNWAAMAAYSLVGAIGRVGAKQRGTGRYEYNARPQWLVDQLKAKAQAKRERKAQVRRWDYEECIRNNKCLSDEQMRRYF